MRHYIPVTAEGVSFSREKTAFLRRAVRTCLASEGVDFPCEIDILITDDEGIRTLNREMREIDRATDVLSFPALTLKPGKLPDPARDADAATGFVPLGDMCISAERVRAQAKEYGHSERRELAYLAVHSVLHLLGYDHEDEGKEKKRMRAHEEQALKQMALSREKETGDEPV